jgi:predicted permease
MRATLRRWRSPASSERDLHDEIESVAEMLADEKRAAGLSDEDARRHARAEIGGVAQVQEAVRQGRAGALIEQTWQDVRYGVRGLGRAPGFTAIAVLTLGLAMGLNTAAFSVADAAVFRPLPYDRPDSLVYIHQVQAGDAPGAAALSGAFMTRPEMASWLEPPGLFTSAAAYNLTYADTEWREQGRVIHVGHLSADMPALLGVSPLAGRTLTRDEADSAAPVLLLSEDTWRRDFNRAASAIGARVTLDDTPYTVIGVMPRAFRYGPGGDGRFDAWTGLPANVGEAGSPPGSLIPVFRLEPGLTIETANRIATSVASRWQEGLDSPWTPRLITLGDDRSARLDSTHRRAWLLLMMCGMVLTIACANVANLLAARSDRRWNELAMRSALGATRARIVRLLLTEGALIATLASGVALACASGLIDALFLLMPPLERQRMFEAGVPAIDSRVLGYSLLVGALVALLASVWSARRGAGATMAPRVADGTPDRRWATAVMQTAQIGLALMLVTGASLTAASFSRTVNHDLGFRPDGLGWLVVEPPANRFPTPEARGLEFERILERIRHLDGVSSAAFGQPPLQPVGNYLFRAGAPAGDVSRAMIDVRLRIGAGYFATVGMTLIAGRDFGPEDAATSTPVAIIDEDTARRLFGDASPIGQRVQRSPRPGTPQFTIVGVVNTASTSRFTSTPSQRLPGGAYFPLSQMLAQSPGAWLMIRSSQPIGGVLAEAARAVSSDTPGLRVVRQTVAGYLEAEETFSTPRFYLFLMAICGSVALCLASTGVYSVLAFSVGQREREIGVRMALGASTGRIGRLVIGDALRPVGAGLVIGTIASLLLSTYIASFLYGVSPRDPAAFIVSATVLVASALVACIGPLRRATGQDPIRAIRS